MIGAYLSVSTVSIVVIGYLLNCLDRQLNNCQVFTHCIISCMLNHLGGQLNCQAFAHCIIGICGMSGMAHPSNSFRMLSGRQ